MHDSTHQVRTTAARIKLEICATLSLVVLVLSIQYGDSMQAHAGSSSSPARICPSIAKRQKHSQVSKQHFNDLGFLNSI